MKGRTRRPSRRCAVCGDTGPDLQPVEGGHLCDACLAALREGRDAETRAARCAAIAMNHQALANRHRHEGREGLADRFQSDACQAAAKTEAWRQIDSPPALALGEVIPADRPKVADTLQTPDRAALDASSHRTELLTRPGNDCCALALDAAHSIGATNSLEKMLAHQLAVAHKSALELTDKAFFEADSVEKARLFNVAARFMDVFQRGLLTMQRLRGGGEQRIVVERVSVADGGQAVIGNVRTGRCKEK